MTTSNQWNSEKMAEVGFALANGYGLGCQKPTGARGGTSNRWTTNTLVQFGKDLSQGYGVGLN